MREIKFQAIIETPDGKVDKYPCGVFDGKVIISTTIPYYGQAYVPLTSEYGELIALRQYTGLRDKNGQEIFEDDICKYLNIYTKNEVWVVAFEDAKFVLKKSPMRFDLGDVDIQCVEVLGNTYENPELCNA